MVSSKGKRVESAVRVSSSISEVSTVAGMAVAIGEGGEMRVRLLEQVDCFFDALAAGRCGHE